MKKIKTLLAITLVSLLAFSCNKGYECECHVPDGTAHQEAEDRGIPYAEDSHTLVYDNISSMKQQEAQKWCSAVSDGDYSLTNCKLRK